MSPHIDLETHITDIINFFRWEQLEDVILVVALIWRLCNQWRG